MLSKGSSQNLLKPNPHPLQKTTGLMFGSEVLTVVPACELIHNIACDIENHKNLGDMLEMDKNSEPMSK
jgi:hypothetical protein